MLVGVQSKSEAPKRMAGAVGSVIGEVYMERRVGIGMISIH